MEERDLYDERQETRKSTLNCPHCHQAAEYELGWFVRTKKRQLPSRADERDRAKYAKARSYMVRRDDWLPAKIPGAASASKCQGYSRWRSSNSCVSGP